MTPQQHDRPPLDISAALRELLVKLHASRVTFRLDVIGMNFPVVGEATDEGIRTLSGDQSLDQRNLATVRYLFGTRDVLVQDDCERVAPPPPPELMTQYGVKAQMLAPLLLDDRVVGWLSVHECRAPRHWTDDEVRILRRSLEDLGERFLGRRPNRAIAKGETS